MRKLYTIRDVLTCYGTVAPGVPAILDLTNDQEALRLVKGSVARGQKPNVLNTNAEDKQLWCVGEFDEKTGRITPCEPYLVASAIDYLESEVQDGKSNQSSEVA